MEGEERASKAAATGAKSKTVKWRRVDFTALSLSELKCAERQLKEAKETFQENDEVSKASQTFELLSMTRTMKSYTMRRLPN